MLYEFQGIRPVIGRDVFVAPNATVIGDVHLGDEASVWFGAVVRGDFFPIRIGARTNIQDGSVVHITAEKAKTTVGDDVTVGHMALIHGCTIGARCLIGMGSIVLDGAIVEDDCVIAAGSLVTPGAYIPAGSMAMGRPAKVVRPLTEADRLWIAASGASYVTSAAMFRTSLRRIADQ
jgi:carbonic anhydrase/acetyltransferase-like protein (isoleucine patch superfamily)